MFNIVAILILLLGSYFLVQKISRWLYLIPLAVLLSIVSSIAAGLALHYIQPDVLSLADASIKMLSGFVLLPFVSVFFMWWFRRKKLNA